MKTNSKALRDLADRVGRADDPDSATALKWAADDIDALKAALREGVDEQGRLRERADALEEKFRDAEDGYVKAAARAEVAQAEVDRLAELLRGVGANRYWEGRWRDEYAERQKVQYRVTVTDDLLRRFLVVTPGHTPRDMPGMYQCQCVRCAVQRYLREYQPNR